MADGDGWTLAVTSSTGVVSLAVGLVADGRVVEAGGSQVVTDRRHAEEISPGLQALLDGCGRRFGDLARLVVDVGPGRFTGLRVGVATVRALAFALEVPVVGLTSLEILAAGEAEKAGEVTAVVDARRQEVFQQRFVAGSAVGSPTVGPPAALAEDAGGLVVGDGADRYAEHYEGRPGVTVVRDRHPDAVTMLALGAGREARPGTEVVPLYLRDPDATPNIRTRVGSGGGPMTATRSVRPMTEADLDAVTAIEAAISPDPWDRGLFAGELAGERRDRHWLVLTEPDPRSATLDTLMAFGGVLFVADEAHIMNLGVALGHRRRGLATALAARLLLDAGDRGAIAATLEVRSDNDPAFALYRRLGFAEAGRRPRYYPNGDDAVIMWVHRIHEPSYRERLRALADAAAVAVGATATVAVVDEEARS